MPTDIEVKKLDDFRWLLPKKGKMRTEGLVYADERMMAVIRKDASLEQVANVACLPGIVGRSLAMPDIHWGYGGYDINCGVRLLRSELDAAEIRDQIPTLVEALFKNIPSGVGSRRKDLRLSAHEMDSVLVKGAGWAVSRGYGSQEDLEHIEERGCIPGGPYRYVRGR
jgi:tRNA-splicing ligase RtcB